MTFWDKAKKVVDQAADSVNREAKSASKQYEISKIEGEIERQYAEMGKRAHDLYRQRELLDAEIGVIAKRIAGLEDELEGARQAVADLRHPGRTGEAASAAAAEKEDQEKPEPESPS
jgi:predicted  nucleic acid-binding Zn-ribbon protein